MLLDGRHLVLAIPDEKRVAAIEMIELLLNKKKTKVKELQQLCGFLNFISKAIFPGRTFTHHMYTKFSKVVNLKGVPASQFDTN